MIKSFFDAAGKNIMKKSHTVNKIVHTAPRHLLSIVTDVDSYEKFLPFCKSSNILRRSDCRMMFDASLRIGVSDLPPLNAIEEEYVSRVKHYQQVSSDGKKKWIVEAKSIKSNLFHELSSSWKLSEVPSLRDDTRIRNATTHVEFMVEMSVTDPIIATALDQVLENVALQQIAAFERRCVDVPYVEET